MKKYGVIILCVLFLLPNIVLGNDLERIKKTVADKITYEASYAAPSQVRGLVYETVGAALRLILTAIEVEERKILKSEEEPKKEE